MRRWLSWLGEHRGVAFVAVVIYAGVTIAIHEVVNGLVRGAQQQLGPKPFLIVACGLMTIAGAALIRALVHVRPPRRMALALWATLIAILALLAYLFLFTVVSEAVHYVQYAILTLLVFPLASRVGEAMLWANLIGIIDEANQYWVLHADWGIYFDWNDVLVNAIGALLGGLLLASAASPLESSRTDRWRISPPLLLTLGLLAGGSVGVATGGIALHTKAKAERSSAAKIVLDRGDLSGDPFWTTAAWAQKSYHVMSTRGGALGLLVFAIFAAGVDRPRQGATG
jgi:hypothetical protein